MCNAIVCNCNVCCECFTLILSLIHSFFNGQGCPKTNLFTVYMYMMTDIQMYSLVYCIHVISCHFKSTMLMTDIQIYNLAYLEAYLPEYL